MKNSNASLCPYCEKQTAALYKNIAETIKVLDDRIKTVSEILQCSVCGGKFTTYDIEEKNYRKVYDIYRERHNLLPAGKITEIRTKLNLSPYEFGLLLNLSEEAVNNIEGGYPFLNEVNKQILSIQETGKALEVLNIKQKDLPKRNYLSIKNKLIKTSPQEYFFNAKKQDLETGFRNFNIDKVENLILYILKKAKNIGKTKLNKLLFYCDFKYFKEYTVSITGITYIHLPLGPVPDNYEIIINDLMKNKKISSDEVFTSYGSLKEYSWEIYKPLIEPDLSLFNDDEIEIVNDIVSMFENLSARSIKNKSHKEEGYKYTKHLDIISYKYAKTLSV